MCFFIAYITFSVIRVWNTIDAENASRSISIYITNDMWICGQWFEWKSLGG